MFSAKFSKFRQLYAFTPRFAIGRCRADRKKDYRRYLRWMGGAWRRGIFRKRPFESGSLRRVRRAMGGEISCQSWNMSAGAGPGETCTLRT